MKGEEILQTLLRSKLYRDLEEAFKALTRISLSFEPFVEIICPRIDRQFAFNPFIHRQLSFAPQEGKASATEIAWLPGICEIIAPITIGSQSIGLLRTGCIVRHGLSHGEITRNLCRSSDTQQISEFVCALPTFPEAALSGISVILWLYGDYLARFGNQLLLEQSLCEPATIVRAKQYIQSHHAENILLTEVAGHAHVSSFYLCKLFKKTTGVNFSEFLVRTRIETAKKLLLNESSLINQVALDSGFQSLAHFNRVFKFLVGVSPREFRKRGAVFHLQNGVNPERFAMISMQRSRS